MIIYHTLILTHVLGQVDIMELLIWYGANVNARNSGGNTPLHICCVHGQEAAAIVLLRRGVNREVLNNSNRSPCQVAIISGNKNVARRIDEHDENEVVKFSDRPSYNPRARPVSQMYQLSISNKNSKKGGVITVLPKLKQSESLNDNQSVSKFGSLKRSMFRATKKSVGERVRIHAVNSTDPYVVTRNYTPQVKEDIALTVGDRVEVLYIGKDGFIEGVCQGKQGWFPGNCVELTTAQDTNANPKKDRTPIYESLKLKRIKIKRSLKGFGFSVRGATCDLDNYRPTPLVPSLQYVAQVDKAGAAEKAGLEVGHFILVINGQQVVTMPHNQVVELVRTTKKVLEMTVTRSLPVNPPIPTVPDNPQVSPFPEIKKPEIPRRARPVQKLMVDNDNSAVRSSDTGQSLLRQQVSRPEKDGRRLGHVNPLFLIPEVEDNVTPPNTTAHKYSTVHKEGRGELRPRVSADEEQVYLYSQKKEVINELQSKSDTFLPRKLSDENKDAYILRNSNGVSVEFSYNETSSSNADDMKTDSKVSDFTIESGYFYNSQGEMVTEERIDSETAITKAESLEKFEFSEKDQNQFDYESQDYFTFDQRFSNASLENNKADSTFDDEGDFTPYEKLSPVDDPPYDTLDRRDLYYSASYEGEDTYDRLNFEYFPDTLEGELPESFNYEQYDNPEIEPANYDHIQTEEEFYQLVGEGDEQLDNSYQPEEVSGTGGDVEAAEEKEDYNLSQFAKAVLEKSLTLKKRPSQQTESNSASESGSNLSLKHSECDKKGESQTSDLGTDISSTYDTDMTLQHNLISPNRDSNNIQTPDIPWENEGEYSYILEDEREIASPPQPVANAKFDLCTIRNMNDSPDSIKRLSNYELLDEYNPQHWKRMLKKVHRETPTKPDETHQFVSRQLATPESKSCDDLFSRDASSQLHPDNRITYTLQEQQVIAGRIPSIYNEELSPDYEDNTAYWNNQQRIVARRSISDSELSKHTDSGDVITSSYETVTPPKPNYSTFPGELLSGETDNDDILLEPYFDFTPTPLDITEEYPPPDLEYTPRIPSPQHTQLLMPPPEGFDETEPEMLPPPPDMEKSFNQETYLPPPPSSLELDTMQEASTLDDITPPMEILYRMDLKHSRQFKKPEEWSTDEVGEWLETFGMEMYQRAFIENDIQGSHLGLLGKEDLTALGITKLGHKMTILNEIKKLHL